MRRVAATVLCVVALATGRLSAQPYSTTPLDSWGVDGPISAIERVGNRLFIGGNFTHAVRAHGGLIAIAGTDGTLQGNFHPRVPSGVRAIVPDGAGGWYVGGAMGATPNLIRVRGDGTIDSTFAPPSVGPVQSIAVSGDRLIAVVNFSLAVYDKVTGLPITWSSPIRSVVRIELVGPSRLLAFGQFTTVGPERRTGIAMIDVATGALLPWAPDIPSFSANAAPPTSEYAVDGNDLYVCGPFTTVNGQAQQWLAKLDLTTGGLLSWAPTVTGVERVEQCSLTVSGDTVYVMLDSLSTRPAFAVDRTSGARIPGWQPPTDFSRSYFYSTRMLAAHGRVYFYSLYLNAPLPQYQYLWAVDGTSGALLTTWTPRPDAGVAAVVVNGPDLLIGGDFVGAQSVSRNGLLALDLDTGSLVEWNPLTGYVTVQDVVATATRLFVNADGITPRVKAFDLETLAEVAWPVSVDLNRSLNTITASSHRVVVGRAVPGVETSSDVLVVLDPVTGERLTPATVFRRASTTGVDIKHIVLAGDRAYLSGVFDFIGGEWRPTIGAVDLNSGAVLPWFVRPGPVSIERLVPGPGFVALGAPFAPAVVTDAESGAVLGQVNLSGSVHQVFDRWALVTGWSPSIRLLDTTTGVVRWAVTTNCPGGPCGYYAYPARAWNDYLVAGGGTLTNGIATPRLLIFPAVGRVSALRADVSGRRVTLSWQLPATEPSPQQLLIEAGRTSGGSDLLVQAVAGTLTTMTGELPPGTYFVRVRAIFASGAANASDEVSFTIGNPPGAPQGLTGVVFNSSTGRFAQLSWSAPATGSVTGYTIEVGSVAGASNLGRFPVAATSITVDRPPAGIFFVRVRAMNEDGTGPPSNEVVVRVP